jgi:hypothetical protein
LDKLFAFIDDENTRCIALLNDHSSEVLGFQYSSGFHQLAYIQDLKIKLYVTLLEMYM